jgi:hypothetical protein
MAFRDGLVVGAGRRIRTPDLLITNQPLYRLSYAGAGHARVKRSLKLRDAYALLH